MKFDRMIACIFIGAGMLTACVTPPSVNSPGGTATPIPGEAQAPPSTIAVAQAEKALAELLKIPSSRLAVISVDSAEWPDTCLGISRPGEPCAAQIVPGFKVVLKAGEIMYTFRTDQSGEQVRMEKAAAPATVSSPGEEKAIQELSGKLKIDPQTIKLVKAEAVDWPDACLGISAAGQMCAQVVTPGYRVVLQANGQSYEYHTNRDGSQAVLANDAGVSQDAVIEWTDQEQACLKVTVGGNTAGLGDCQGHLSSNTGLEPARQAELVILAGAWKPFLLTLEKGEVSYHGTGQVEATPEEQRSVSEWIHLVHDEAVTGRGNAAAGLALSWHREGGIAGFCDDLVIYVTGFAYPGSCKNGSARDLRRLRLSSDQLAQVYSWINAFQAVHFASEDNASADAMRQQVVLNGTGIRAPSLDDKQAMMLLASEVQAAAITP